jgi:hypothetical protein
MGFRLAEFKTKNHLQSFSQAQEEPMLRFIFAAFAAFIICSLPAKADGHWGSVEHWQHAVWAEYAPAIMEAAGKPPVPNLNAALRDADNPNHREAHLWAEAVADVYWLNYRELPPELLDRVDAALARAELENGGSLCAFSNERVTQAVWQNTPPAAPDALRVSVRDTDPQDFWSQLIETVQWVVGLTALGFLIVALMQRPWRTDSDGYSEEQL